MTYTRLVPSRVFRVVCDTHHPKYPGGNQSGVCTAASPCCTTQSLRVLLAPATTPAHRHPFDTCAAVAITTTQSSTHERICTPCAGFKTPHRACPAKLAPAADQQTTSYQQTSPYSPVNFRSEEHCYFTTAHLTSRQCQNQAQAPIELSAEALAFIFSAFL